MLVRLGKLLDGEGKSKKDDIDIGVHDESGALYPPRNQKKLFSTRLKIISERITQAFTKKWLAFAEEGINDVAFLVKQRSIIILMASLA